jgi:hypothetical protein
VVVLAGGECGQRRSHSHCRGRGMTIAIKSRPRQTTQPMSKQRLRLWIHILRAARASKRGARTAPCQFG